MAFLIGFALAMRFFRIWQREYRIYRLVLGLASKSAEAKRGELQIAASADRVDAERILDYARKRSKQAESYRYVWMLLGMIVLAAVFIWTAQRMSGGPRQGEWIEEVASREAYLLGLRVGFLPGFVGLIMAGFILEIISLDRKMEHQLARLLLRLAGRSQYVPAE